MTKPNRIALLEEAAKARLQAVAPYSRFRVGAALATAQGVVIPGANVESASYGLTCCAERVALFRALTSGEKDFVALAIVAAVAGGPTPCGACRQLLAEYAASATIWTAHPDHLEGGREFTVRELLPDAFVGFQADS